MAKSVFLAFAKISVLVLQFQVSPYSKWNIKRFFLSNSNSFSEEIKSFHLTCFSVASYFLTCYRCCLYRHVPENNKDHLAVLPHSTTAEIRHVKQAFNYPAIIPSPQNDYFIIQWEIVVLTSYKYSLLLHLLQVMLAFNNFKSIIWRVQRIFISTALGCLGIQIPVLN